MSSDYYLRIKEAALIKEEMPIINKKNVCHTKFVLMCKLLGL